MPDPQKRLRVVVVRLHCGCLKELETGRYRVSADVRALVVGHAVRTGVWCGRHGGKDQVAECLGVAAQGSTRSRSSG